MKPTTMKKKKKNSIVPIVQIFFFSLIALIVANHALAEIGMKIPFLSSTSLHAICPFGGVESIYTYLTTGAFVKKIQTSSFVLMFIVFIVTLGFGALFCGWICPLGSFQAFISKVGKKLFKNKYNSIIPTKLDNILRYLRYGVFLWIIYMTAVTARLVFSDYCPYDALFNLLGGNAAIGGVLVLSSIILLSLVVERPFCKYACPYGALLGLGNTIRLFKLRRNPETCISCGICDKVCPMNIKISDKIVVNDHQCISCMKCTSEEACPVENTLNFTFIRRKAIPFKQITVGIITFVLLFGGVTLAINLDLWKSTSNRAPAKLTQGEFVGAYNPADIRGNYTLSDTSRYFDIPLEDLTAAFGIPLEHAHHIQHGDLEEIYHVLDERGTEVGNGSVKLFVALYTGLPYEVEEATYLLEPAVDLLISLGTLSEEEIVYIESHKIARDAYGELDWSILEEKHAEEGVIEIKGNTTFSDVMQWGVTQEEIEALIGGPLPDPSISIQSYTIEKDLGFGKIKEDLQNRIK